LPSLSSGNGALGKRRAGRADVETRRIGERSTAMHWEQVGMGLRRAMKQAGLGGALVTGLLLLGLPADAGDFFYASSFYAGGLPSESSWQQIIKTPGVYAESPFLNFGKSFISVGALCAEGELLRIADPRADNGVRVSAATAGPAGERQARTEYGSLRADVLSASDVSSQPPAEETRSTALRYSVTVYKVLSGGLTVERVFLFAKAWEIPPGRHRGVSTDPPFSFQPRAADQCRCWGSIA
jgi:hypothetical protein